MSKLSIAQSTVRRDFFAGAHAYSQSTRQADGSYIDEDKGYLIFDAGTRISPKFNMTDKARRLISYFLQQGVGYSCGINTLIKKTWAKWEGQTYTTKDVLTQNDIASAIKGLYKGVATGEYKWKNGSRLMLKVTMDNNGTQMIKLTEFVDGLFVIADAPKVEAKADDEAKVAESKAGFGGKGKDEVEGISAEPTLEDLMAKIAQIVNYEDALEALNKAYNK